MSRGRIAVYSDTHKLLDSRMYYTVGGMKRAMAEFMQHEFGYYIQVQPYARYDGTKDAAIRLEIIKNMEKQKIQRLPGIYDNTYKSLYPKDSQI